MADLKREFGLWGVDFGDWDVKKPKYPETKVTVSFKKSGRLVVLNYNKQSRAEDNLRAVFKAIEDMRMIDVREVGELVASTFKQIGAGEEYIPLDPYEVLGIREDADLETAEAMFKIKAKKVHPDQGGSPKQMADLNRAIESIRSKFK